MKSLPETYTVPEAAAYLKLHPETVREMIRQGKLTAAKIGRRFVIRHSTLDDYLTAKENERVQASVPNSRSTLCPNKKIANENKDCINATVLGTLTSGQSAVQELDALLALKTNNKPSNCSIN